MVDSADVEEMKEAKIELHNYTRVSENEGMPDLAVARKKQTQDLNFSSFSPTFRKH